MTAVDAGIRVATEPVPASSATTQTIDLGVSVFGTIETSGDQDWFRVNLVAGQTYEFRLHGFGLTELADTLLRLFGPDGVTLLLTNDNSASWDGANGTDSRIVFTATQTGTYYISAGGYSTNTGDYLLTAVPQNPSGMVFTPDEIAWQLIHNYNEQGTGSEVAWNVGADRTLTVNITGLTAAGQALARAALQMWSDVTGIIFQEITTSAEITFEDSDAGANAYASWTYSGKTITSATVMITTAWLQAYGTGFNSYSFETYIHEIGHALGLGHGGNYNGSATYGVDNYYLNDSLYLSIMSYMQANGDDIGGPNTFVGADFRHMLTPALADIIAVNMLYGRSTTTRTGNTTYGYNANTSSAVLNSFVTTPDAFMTVHDDGGTDTLDFSGYSGAQTIDLNAGASSNVMGGVYNLWISRSTTIENAIGGSGADTIIGNAANNVLNGGGGSDTIYLSYQYGSGYSILAGGTSASFTIIGVAGADLILNAEFIHFSNGVTISTTDLLAAYFAYDAENDFNGDGTSDILFRNATTGSLGEFVMNNGTPTWAGIGWAPNTLAVVGVGDFNGDGTDDILFRETSTGSFGQFVINNGTPTWTYVGWSPVTWEVVGVGDFNADGTDDVLLRDPATGSVGQFVMNNGVPAWAAVGWTPPNLVVVGVGDFNGDGTDDILFRDLSTGSVGQFVMNNGIPTWSFIGWAPTDLVLVGVGDFNGDGTDDILFRETATGSIGQFIISNGVPTWSYLGWAPTNYEVVSIGDYNSDGTDDILFFDPNTGTLGQFEMHSGIPTWEIVGWTGTDWDVM